MLIELRTTSSVRCSRPDARRGAGIELMRVGPHQIALRECRGWQDRCASWNDVTADILRQVIPPPLASCAFFQAASVSSQYCERHSPHRPAPPPQAPATARLSIAKTVMLPNASAFRNKRRENPRAPSVAGGRHSDGYRSRRSARGTNTAEEVEVSVVVADGKKIRLVRLHKQMMINGVPSSVPVARPALGAVQRSFVLKPVVLFSEARIL